MSYIGSETGGRADSQRKQAECDRTPFDPGAPDLTKPVRAQVSHLGGHLKQKRPDPDILVILRVKAGDTAAFEELVARHERPIMAFVVGILGDPTEAEDVTQTVFLRAFKFAPGFEPAAKVSTWLFIIARNLCLNELRRRSRYILGSVRGEEDEICAERFWECSAVEHRTASAVVVEDELRQKINEALAALPLRQRAALLLLREEDRSYAEIAMALRTSVSATKTLIHSGRKALKRKLVPYLRTGMWWNHGPPRRPSPTALRGQILRAVPRARVMTA